MSALPPKADMCSALAYVRFGPIADIRFGKASNNETLGAGDQFQAAWPNALVTRSLRRSTLARCVRFAPNSGNQREPLVAENTRRPSHFHEEGSLLCELSHIETPAGPIHYSQYELSCACL